VDKIQYRNKGSVGRESEAGQEVRDAGDPCPKKKKQKVRAITSSACAGVRADTASASFHLLGRIHPNPYWDPNKEGKKQPRQAYFPFSHFL
jgi:hypothetical protein